ncbi:inositol monophosphatase 3-like [Babylonia areolata]|uniref:inositol monophosphatase 3-like n=1 Tax=Babylonia areolata TaxID=304850 RepID=UPI003FD2260D
MAPATVRLNPVGLLIAVVLAICLFFYIFGIPGFSRNERVSMRELLSVSIVLAERGGKRVREIADAHKLQATSKGKTKEGAKEMLTQGDLESHRTIVNGFLKAFPGLTVISEEHENKPVDFNQIPDVDKQLFEVVTSVLSDQKIPINNIAVWIDPLDATQEYTEGLYEYVTTMVCVVVNGEPTIGVIHRPFTDETVWAWVDYGHSPNLKKAPERNEGDLEHQQIIVSRSHQGHVKDVAKKALGEKTEVVPAGGAGYKTLELIKGNVDAYVHVTLIKKWDICAGHAILKAVEGRMTTLEGNYITYYPSDSPKNEDGLLATLYHHYDLLKKLTPEMDTLKGKRQR